MKHILALLTAGSLASGFAAYAQTSAPAPSVTLTRLDCGTSNGPRDVAAFSDTHAYDGQKKQLVASCYLIRHGDDLMLWDTGYALSIRQAPGTPMLLPKSIVDQLRELRVDPAKVSRVGISHYHGDHIGQARDFPQATLMIGAGDWAALTAPKPDGAAMGGVDPAPVAHWVSGGGKVEQVGRDKDVFGDGSVVMLDAPGHTPGHHSLLVRLKTKGPVLLSGDITHFQENYATDGIPSFNTNRADSLASLHRFKATAANLKATVIIQHDPRDVAKLPAFPASAD
jgi:glyoxylase-like metal-dependent hydrolase (beta-lactamase superfamily II)